MQRGWTLARNSTRRPHRGRLGISPHERCTRRLSAPQEAVKVRVLDRARSFGVDLTPESANIRGLRRRRVPWSQIQAVLGYRQMGADRMALALDSGERVVLRMPATYWGSGAATDVKCWEDFHRLGQWCLAHRGPSWRPARPEAPGAPIPE